MCGKNTHTVTDFEFIAGCNRFGLDNPTPIVTRRLAIFGNEETVEKLVEKLALQYNNINIIDSEAFGGPPETQAQSRAAGILADDSLVSAKDRKKARDMEETKLDKRTGKKVSGVHDIKMLDRINAAKKFESPAEVVLARGISIKIKDIPKSTSLKGKALAPERMTNYEVDPKNNTQLVVPSFGTAGALFARHFDILSTVKRRIYLLKQAYLS